MLVDLIKDSITRRASDKFEFYNETDSSALNKKIIRNFINKENKNESSETEYFFNYDDSAFSPSFTISLVNRPLINKTMDLIKMVNETSIKFNKTNVSFQVINKKPLIVITASFFFLDDLESLLFKDIFGYESYDKNSEESKNASSKIESIIGSMVIALLEASMFIDEQSIKLMDDLIAEEDDHVK